jgi:hypothetical protein
MRVLNNRWLKSNEVAKEGRKREKITGLKP